MSASTFRTIYYTRIFSIPSQNCGSGLVLMTLCISQVWFLNVWKNKPPELCMHIWTFNSGFNFVVAMQSISYSNRVHAWQKRIHIYANSAKSPKLMTISSNCLSSWSVAYLLIIQKRATAMKIFVAAWFMRIFCCCFDIPIFSNFIFFSAEGHFLHALYGNKLQERKRFEGNWTKWILLLLCILLYTNCIFQNVSMRSIEGRDDRGLCFFFCF